MTTTRNEKLETLSLEELKRKNAEEEATEPEAPQAEEEEVETEAGEEETEETEADADNAEESEEESELEAWQLEGDEQGSQGNDGQAVPVAKHAQMRSKLKGKISERDEEIERLKAEIEAIKNGGVSKPVQPKSNVQRPKLEDFEYDEDKYQAALDDWYEQKLEVKLSNVQQAQQQREHQRKQEEALNKAVDSHYERAAKLAEESGISPEMYQQSDLEVRKVIDTALPGKGDLVTDQLISVLGEGSEKVMYYLGRNKSAQAELQSALFSDPTGLKAIAWLGRKAAEVTKPVKKVSRAPKPATRVDGDESGTASSRALKKKYQEAHKQKSVQKAFEIRREARKKGIDVSNW